MSGLSLRVVQGGARCDQTGWTALSTGVRDQVEHPVGVAPAPGATHAGELGEVWRGAARRAPEDGAPVVQQREPVKGEEDLRRWLVDRGDCPQKWGPNA